jgi:hypothetical protein
MYASLYASAWAGPHEHGVVHMTIAIEGANVQLALRAPQESLLGYERAPREGSEKQQAAKLIEQMRSAESVIQWNAQAQCKSTSASVSAPGLQGKAEAGGHADIEAQYRFECGQAAQLRSAQVPLFELSRRHQPGSGASGRTAGAVAIDSAAQPARVSNRQIGRSMVEPASVLQDQRPAPALARAGARPAADRRLVPASRAAPARAGRQWQRQKHAAVAGRRRLACDRRPGQPAGPKLARFARRPARAMAGRSCGLPGFSSSTCCPT